LRVPTAREAAQLRRARDDRAVARESVGEACGAVPVLAWRIERARRGREARRCKHWSERSERSAQRVVDRERAEGFRELDVAAEKTPSERAEGVL